MALRTYFTLQPGIPLPQDFKPQGVPLLALQDLWEASRPCPPSLLFRVRSESEAGAPFSTEDRIESCVGLIDAVVRWRVVFRMLGDAVASIQHPQLKEICGAALQFAATRHPATVSTRDRDEIVAALMKLLAEDGDGAPHIFEKLLADAVGRLAVADNDVEAAAVVPAVRAFCPFDPERQRIEYAGRMATLETLSGATVLVEAQRRLSERLPIWHVAAAPAVVPSGAPPREEDGEE